MSQSFSGFESAAEHIMLLSCIPGMAVSVARDGEVLFEKGFGFRDRANRFLVDSDTIFGYASITKSFTAVAIMQLVEQGRLSVSDPVQRHIPELELRGPASASVTVEDLLHHRAGLPPLPGSDYVKRITTNEVPGFPSWDPQQPRTSADGLPQLHSFDDFISYMNGVPYTVLGRPGEYFSYSNESWTLLGIIVERVSGVPYREFVKKRILEPLGMERVSFSTESLDGTPNVSQIFMVNKLGETRLVPAYTSIRSFDPAGGLRGSVKDLSRWARMFAAEGSGLGGRVLSPSSVARMWQNAPLADMGRSYGYGIAIEPFGSGHLVSHGGGYIGISSSFGFVPGSGVSVAVLTNIQEVPAARVMALAAATALGIEQPVTEMPRLVDIPAARHNLYAGTYMSGENKSLEIVSSGGTLLARTETLEAPVKQLDGDHICAVTPGGPVVMKVFADDSGTVWALLSGLRMLVKKN